MGGLMNTTSQTPIEIALGIDENGMTTARALYDFLELGQGQFSRWAKTHIENNEFYEEGHDWWGFDIMSSGNKCRDYRITTEFAKHLSMESHSAKGKLARQYFVAVEDKMKDMAIQIQSMSPELRAVLVVDQRVTRVENKTDTLRQDFESFKSELPILGMEERRIVASAKKKGMECLGGKDSPAYKNRSIRASLYKDIYGELHRQFGVSNYRELKRSQTELAVQIISAYRAPYVLETQIEQCNRQTRL